MPIEKLLLSAITADSRVQPRAAGLDTTVVAEYAERYRSGQQMEPGVVYRDRGKIYWLSEGFHRLAGASEAGLRELSFDVRDGGIIDAKLNAAASNAKHGLRRTSDDMRRAVRLCLESRSEWDSEQVARHCQVSRSLVDDVRVSITAGKHGTQVGEVIDPEQKSKGPGRKSDRAKRVDRAARVLKESPELTDEAVAAKASCGKKTVAEVRRVMEEQGKIPRKGQKTKKKDPLKDANGIDIPDGLRDLFGDTWPEECADKLEVARIEFEAICRSAKANGAAWQWMFVSKIIDLLENVQKELALGTDYFRSGKPYAVCPKCGGTNPPPDCPWCVGAGWLTKWRLAEMENKRN